MGSGLDWGLSLWDSYQDHVACLNQCNIDLDSSCECNGK
jgi:hypothetical protein